MIVAVRVTSRGALALSHYINEEPFWILGKRVWNPDELDVAVLAVSGNKGQWTRLRSIVERLSESGVDVKVNEFKLSKSIRQLEADSLIELLRDIKEQTVLKVEIGNWTLTTTWKSFKAQANGLTARELAKEISWKGYYEVPGDPPLRIRLQ